MKSILIVFGAIAIAVVAYFAIAPREQREAMLDKVAVLGDSSGGEKTPLIVREQQRKERIRQDNSWTPENRTRHPIEYCQAQLEEIQRYSNELEARAHEKGCAIAAVKREVDNMEAMSKAYDKFLTEAVVKYEECETANSWPATAGGFLLSREKMQDKMIDAAQKIAENKLRMVSKKNQIVYLEKTLKATQDEQKRVGKIREHIQNTISDQRIKKVIDGDNSIVAALNEIEDAVGRLGVSYDDPPIESIVQPDDKTTREGLFKKIMAEYTKR